MCEILRSGIARAMEQLSGLGLGLGVIFWGSLSRGRGPIRGTPPLELAAPLNNSALPALARHGGDGVDCVIGTILLQLLAGSHCLLYHQVVVVREEPFCR